jgi:hypothetical protein
LFVAARRLGAGAAGGPAAQSKVASLGATVVGLPVLLVAAPAAPRGAVVGAGSVKGGGLPEEAGELAGAGDRDDAGWFAPLLA